MSNTDPRDIFYPGEYFYRYQTNQHFAWDVQSGSWYEFIPEQQQPPQQLPPQQQPQYRQQQQYNTQYDQQQYDQQQAYQQQQQYQQPEAPLSQASFVQQPLIEQQLAREAMERLQAQPKRPPWEKDEDPKTRDRIFGLSAEIRR
jgi:hypothetical protein